MSLWYRRRDVSLDHFGRAGGWRGTVGDALSQLVTFTLSGEGRGKGRRRSRTGEGRIAIRRRERGNGNMEREKKGKSGRRKVNQG